MDSTSPLKRIRQYCLQCSGDSTNEVKHCPIKSCPLYDLRFGKSGRTRSMTEEQKQAAAERLKLARLVKKSLTNNEEFSDQLIKQYKCRVNGLGKFIDYL